MATIMREEYLKLNLIHLVEDHRAKCDRECNVTLCLILELAERAGLTFTEDEKQLFF